MDKYQEVLNRTVLSLPTFKVDAVIKSKEVILITWVLLPGQNKYAMCGTNTLQPDEWKIWKSILQQRNDDPSPAISEVIRLGNPEEGEN